RNLAILPPRCSAWKNAALRWIVHSRAGAHFMAANTIDSHVERYKLEDSVGNFMIGCLRDKHILTADLRKAFYQNRGTLDLFDIELGEQVKIQPLHLKLSCKQSRRAHPYSPATNLIAFSTLK